MIEIPSSFILYINIAVIIFYLILFVAGFNKGFLLQLVNLVGTFVSIFVAYRYYDIGNRYFQLFPRSLLPLQDTLVKDEIYNLANRILWFVILFVIVKLVFFIISFCVKGLQKIPGLKEISSFLGGLIGLLLATVWIVITSLVLAMPVFSNGRIIKEGSWIGLISNKVEESIELLDINDSSELFDEIYLQVNNLPDDDKEVIEEWLKSNGYEEAE